MLSHLRLADHPLDVADVVQSLTLNAELVSLSACETGRSQILRGDELIGLTRAFLYAGTPSVLVSHWAVDELSTRLLMEQFYQALSRPATTKAEALSRAQHYIRTLGFEALREAARAGAPAAEVDSHLQSLAHSAGYGALRELHGDEQLLRHPYYWAPFFLVGDRLQAPAA
jgi:CHAT domain-containing protein